MNLKKLGLALPLMVLSSFTMAQTALEIRITAIEDHIAIEKIIMGDYPRALDEMRMDDYAALWAEDGVLVIPSLATLRGPANIERFLSQPGVFGEENDEPRPAPSPYQVPHMVGSLSYDIDGNTAIGSSYWIETVLVDGEPKVAGSGHYVDELEKINGEWKFTYRQVVRDVPVMTPEEFNYAPEIEF